MYLLSVSFKAGKLMKFSHAFPMFNLRLISAHVPFVFVTVTPRYLNISIFANDNFQLLYFDFVPHFGGNM